LAVAVQGEDQESAEAELVAVARTRAAVENLIWFWVGMVSGRCGLGVEHNGGAGGGAG
jgi:hypothetical protein